MQRWDDTATRSNSHLAEAVEVIIKSLGLLDHKALSQRDRDALQVLLGDVAAIRGIKDSLATPSIRQTQTN